MTINSEKRAWKVDNLVLQESEYSLSVWDFSGQGYKWQVCIAHSQLVEWSGVCPTCEEAMAAAEAVLDRELANQAQGEKR